MLSQTPIVFAFDLYGTLLSTVSITEELNKYLSPSKAKDVAATWRTYQLEYTWRLNSMQKYIPFSTVTARSLQNALHAHNATLPQAAHDSLMAAYDSLSTFPDVPPALTRLVKQGPEKFRCYVFSNGTDAMVSNSVHRSQSLAAHANVFADVITVEEVQCFKPDPKVYEMLARKVGKQGHEGDVWLISGNPFDVVGARAMGMQAAWLDRESRGWADQLLGDGENGKPTVVISQLGELVDRVEDWLENKS